MLSACDLKHSANSPFKHFSFVFRRNGSTWFPVPRPTKSNKFLPLCRPWICWLSDVTLTTCGCCCWWVFVSSANWTHWTFSNRTAMTKVSKTLLHISIWNHKSRFNFYSIISLTLSRKEALSGTCKSISLYWQLANGEIFDSLQCCESLRQCLNNIRIFSRKEKPTHKKELRM